MSSKSFNNIWVLIKSCQFALSTSNLEPVNIWGTLISSTVTNVSFSFLILYPKNADTHPLSDPCHAPPLPCPTLHRLTKTQLVWRATLPNIQLLSTALHYTSSVDTGIVQHELADPCLDLEWGVEWLGTGRRVGGGGCYRRSGEGEQYCRCRYGWRNLKDTADYWIRFMKCTLLNYEMVIGEDILFFKYFC